MTRQPSEPTGEPEKPVYFCNRCYGYRRVCYELSVPGYRFTYNRALPIKRLLHNSSFWDTTRLFFPKVRGLVHTFNDIVINADAWMVSFELELPRFLKTTKDWHRKIAFDRLADNRCRHILAISDAGRRWFLRRLPEELREPIAKKVHVFSGGVMGPEHFGVPCDNEPRERHQQLHLVFVGNNAFRKGGLYVLDAFDRLRQQGVDAKLTFISRVQSQSYVLAPTAEERARMLDRLQNTRHVTWISNAPNKQVMSILADAHLGLLPTLDDTLGWSIIEMMATYTPAIASNVVAIPELIEDGESGRLISIPCDEDNRWVGLFNSHDDIRAYTHKLLVDGLVESVSALYQDDAKRLRMASLARDRYEQRYTPEIAGYRLQGFYDEAIGAASN